MYLPPSQHKDDPELEAVIDSVMDQVEQHPAVKKIVDLLSSRGGYDRAQYGCNLSISIEINPNFDIDGPSCWRFRASKGKKQYWKFARLKEFT